MIKLLLDKQIFASSDAITAATRKIFSTTCTILALTWFCHLNVYLWSLGGGLRSPKGGPPPYTWKKLQCLKMIFRPFGVKKIKKIGYGKWPLLTPPSMEFSIIFFFEPFPKCRVRIILKIVYILTDIGWNRLFSMAFFSLNSSSFNIFKCTFTK